MISALRDYQSTQYQEARRALVDYRAICLQGATGSGKTPMIAAMCESVLKKKKRAWIIVNRKELLSQASAHLLKWSVPHGIVSPSMQESRAYNIHVVSKDTLIRRYDKIKNWPDLIIFDECHLYLDRQIEIVSHLPETSKIIGFTATPERLDGRGLSEIYETLIEGLSIPELTRQGFLSPLRYFSPPIEGLADLHVKGMDYDEEELEALLERRKIYGELVGHYEKWGKGKPALIFCRSVKAAYQTAERFRDKGFNFYCIEGKMGDKKRRDLIAALTKGDIDGLTNCEIATYGLDIPRVEYGASIRPTLSRALYMQMIGRILRPFVNTDTRYKKQEAFFFDHVNSVIEHQDDNYPGIPLHYVPKITWNFDGTEKRKRKKDKNNIRLCPLLDFFYCDRPTCAGCKYNKDKNETDQRKPMLVINTDLKEVEKPAVFAELPFEDRRIIQDSIGSAVLEYRNMDIKYNAEKDEEQKKLYYGLKYKEVEKLNGIAIKFGYSAFWLYHRLSDPDRKTVDVPLLAIIGKVKGFKPGWVWFAKEKIHVNNKTKEEFEEVMNG